MAEKSSDIVITSHISPDPDSIASVLSTYSVLISKYPNKKIRIIYTGGLFSDFNMFEYFDQIEFVSDIAEHLAESDLLIMLDGGQYSRFTRSSESIETFLGKRICIDHHSSPPDAFDLGLISPLATSTSELIYRTFCADKEIDKTLAETFLLGILGDTGNLSYVKPSQTETFIIVKRLTEAAQVSIDELQARYSSIPKQAMSIVGEFLKNVKYHYLPDWPGFSATFIDRRFIADGGYQEGDVAFAKDIYTALFLRKIKDYPWGFVIVPHQNGDCRISFRSNPNSVNVLEISQQMQLGGGHIRAAGGTFKHDQEDLSPTDCMNLVLEWIKSHKPAIE